MALKQKSLILYGLQITENNRSLDFKAASLGSTKLATLNLGFYSLQGLCNEISRAMISADPANIYTCSVNRSVAGGLENRLTISTSGTHLDLLFSSGPRAASAIAPLIGFASNDFTGSTSYSGSASCGTPLVPDYLGYNYLGPSLQQKVFGNVNVSASGLKESIVFAIQKFVQVEFKYEPEQKMIDEWEPFMSWAIQQRPFEFTPEVTSPNTVYDVTLEKTDMEGKGLGFRMKELLPDFPGRYTTGMLQFRLTPISG